MKVYNNISLISMVKNESKHIRKMLESIKGLVKEIIIVDTGSTDDTVDICLEYGAKIISNPYKWDEKIFQVNKQIALDHATENWILNLDADEELSAELEDEVRIFIHQNEHDVLSMSRVNFIKDKKNNFEEVLYLFRNFMGYRYICHLPCHASIALSDKITDIGRLKHAKGLVYHFGWYDISNEDYQIKRDHYKEYLPFVTKEI